MDKEPVANDIKLFMCSFLVGCRGRYASARFKNGCLQFAEVGKYEKKSIR